MGMNSVNVCGAQNGKYRTVNSWDGTSGMHAQLLIGSTAGAIILMIKGYSTQAGFLQLFDSKSASANGTSPLAAQAVAANDNFSFLIPVCGLPPLANGIYLAMSSTVDTLTLMGGAVAWIEVYFI